MVEKRQRGRDEWKAYSKWFHPLEIVRKSLKQSVQKVKTWEGVSSQGRCKTLSRGHLKNSEHWAWIKSDGSNVFYLLNHWTSTDCISDSRTPPTTNNHPPHLKPIQPILTPEIALRRSSLPAGLGRSLAPSPGARLASHSPRWRAHWQGEAGWERPLWTKRLFPTPPKPRGPLSNPAHSEERRGQSEKIL